MNLKALLVYTYEDMPSLHMIYLILFQHITIAMARATGCLARVVHFSTLPYYSIRTYYAVVYRRAEVVAVEKVYTMQ